MGRSTAAMILSWTSLVIAPRAFPADSATTLAVPIYGRHGEEVKQLQSTSTESTNFAAGGLIRITGSYGDLVVEGWDHPMVETSVTKLLSYGFKEDKQRLDRVRAETKRVSNSELAITTIAPSANKLFWPFTGKGEGVKMEYTIHVPRNSRLEIHHGVGMVTVRNVIGDINATGRRGDVLVWLPKGGIYAIDARSKFGIVASDFAGSPQLAFYRLGEHFASEDAPSSPRIRLRMGFGGITIKSLPRESQTMAPR